MKDAPSKTYNCPEEVSGCLVLLKNKTEKRKKKNIKATTKKKHGCRDYLIFPLLKKEKKNVGVDSGSTDKDIEKLPFLVLTHIIWRLLCSWLSVVHY